MGWLDRLLTPKSVEDAMAEQDAASKQLADNIKYYDLRGLEEAEKLLRGEKIDAVP